MSSATDAPDARTEDRELLRGLATVLRERLDERAGPDRRAAIAELELHDDLPAAKRAMRAPEQRLAAAEARRKAAGDRVSPSASIRTRLPGRRGRHARNEQLRAEGDLVAARHEEQRALRDVEEGRHRLDRAERCHEALRGLRDEQGRRDAYLADHSEEADFAKALRGMWRQSDDQPTPADGSKRNRAPRHVDVGVGVDEDPRLHRPVPGPARRGPGLGR